MPWRQTLASGVPRAVAAGDLDGDGRIDLVVAVDGGPGAGTLVVFTGRADLGFSQTATAVDKLDFPVTGSVDLAIADFDGDGPLDVALAWGPLAVFRGDGAGHLADATMLAAGGANHVIAADLDGDGRPDLAAGGSAILVLLNRSN